MRAVTAYVNGVTFDKYSEGKHPEVHADSVTMRGYLKRILRDSGMPKQGQDELEDAVTWMPGNIRRGPESKTRLTPKAGQDFDELVDDGRDALEKAAANLVETPHFQRLDALKGKLSSLPWSGSGAAVERGAPRATTSPRTVRSAPGSLRAAARSYASLAEGGRGMTSP